MARGAGYVGASGFTTEGGTQLVEDQTKEVAARCLADGDYARRILEGEEYPEVRNAIIADLSEEDAVHGYLNPQPQPPSPQLRSLGSVRFTEQLFAPQVWHSLMLTNLRGLTLH
jgi:hypothetical protein